MIRVLTFNIWGLPGIFFWDLAPHREKRIRSVCADLAKQEWDFVLIQEAWLQKDRQRLKDCGYPYALDLDSNQNRLDSGLLILSRHPVYSGTETRIKYKTNGDFKNCLSDGEFFVNKSVIMADFEHPEKGRVSIANTHLVSSGGARDRYRDQRLAQIRELTAAIAPRAVSNPVILGGDFNCGPGSGEWSELTAGLEGFSIQKGCYRTPHTFVSQKYSAKLDHIFTSRHFERLDSRVQFDHRLGHNGHSFQPSDHLALEAVFADPPSQ